jgi:hypothetical protein
MAQRACGRLVCLCSGSLGADVRICEEGMGSQASRPSAQGLSHATVTRPPALTADAPDDRGVNETIMGEVTLDGVASWRKMSKSPSRFPVTVTHLPVTRCQLCRHTVAYRPGAISETLTEHYRRAHPKRLILLSVAP